MIDSMGPRVAAFAGPAATTPDVQAGEKIVHRPPSRVLPVEPMDPTAPAGPRPAFRHTYLEQVAALWPDEPGPPVTQIDQEATEAETPPPADTRSAEEALAAMRREAVNGPTVDIRR